MHFPALDITRSGTRKEELLVHRVLKKMYVLRRILNPMGTVDAIEFLLDKLRQTKTNGDFIFRIDEHIRSVAIGGLSPGALSQNSDGRGPGQRRKTPRNSGLGAAGCGLDKARLAVGVGLLGARRKDAGVVFFHVAILQDEKSLMRRAVVSDTIYALSSGQGRAGVAVVRLSGPAVRDVFQILCGKVPPERMATLMTVRHQGDRDIIDKGLGLCFLAPRSFTGEDMGEFQLHGGRAVVTRLLDALSRIEGLRPAEAGEFTKRAFLNGKLDLVEVEGLGDVVSADTEGQLKLAQRLARGGLSERVALWRKELVSAMSLVEAAIDFSDEADVTTDIGSEVRPRVKAVLAEIEAVLDDGGRGERLRDGVVVAIAGPPNAGKSTVLNLLARREAAIVSPFAGTTYYGRGASRTGRRPVTPIDTAGLREGGDSGRGHGGRPCAGAGGEGDLVLWLEPVTEKGGMPAGFGNSLRVATKLGGGVQFSSRPCDQRRDDAGISVAGDGSSPACGLAGAEETPLIMRARQRAALLGGADEFWSLAVGTVPPTVEERGIELQAEHLRRAMRAWGACLVRSTWRRC